MGELKMGAELYEMTATGKNVKEVFDSLVDEAIYHYGHDSYNGQISTTSLSHEIELTKDVEKLMKKGFESDEYFNKFFPEKRYTPYVKKVSHYKSYTPKWVNDKETVTRKKGVRNEQRFAVIPESEIHKRYYPTTFKTISEAKRDAKKLALRRGENIVIKQFRSNSEMFQLGVMRLETDGKEYKSKRSAKTKVYLPEYEFTFFVCAAS